MSIRRMLVISTLLAGSTVTGAGYALDGFPGARERAAGQRNDMAHRHHAPPRLALHRIIQNTDTDADHQIDLEEFIARRTANYTRQFDWLDNDDNGLLTNDEASLRHRVPLRSSRQDTAALRACIAANSANPGRQEDLFTTADSNGDDALDKEELREHLERQASDRFPRIDINDDGQLTIEEMAGNMRKHNTMHTCINQTSNSPL